jgi:hypothetical protein
MKERLAVLVAIAIMVIGVTFAFLHLAHAGGFAVSVDSTTTSSVTTTSAILVPADAHRNYLLIQNNGTASIIIKPSTVQAASEGVVITAGGSYEPAKGIIDKIYAKSVSGTQSVVVISGR